jgi:hypothetical protein
MTLRKDYYPSHELQMENYLYWKAYLLRFPWEWWVTLTTEPESNYYKNMRLLKEWTQNLYREERIQIAFFYVSSYKKPKGDRSTQNSASGKQYESDLPEGHIHIHLLMLGSSRNDKSLIDVSRHKWESRWVYIAKIKEIDSLEGVCNYFAMQTLGFRSDHYEIECYNKSLLKKVMTPMYDGYDPPSEAEDLYLD